MKYDARIERVAALYRSGTSTDSLPAPQASTAAQAPDRARLWQSELAKSMANIERRRPVIVPAVPLRPIPGLMIVATH